MRRHAGGGYDYFNAPGFRFFNKVFGPIGLTMSGTYLLFEGHTEFAQDITAYRNGFSIGFAPQDY
jgi:hypothetical protein